MAEDSFIRSIPPEIQLASTFRAHNDSVDCIRLQESGTSPILVSASHDNTLKVWDLPSQSAISTLSGHTEAVFCCAISDSGQIASCSPDQTVRTWDIRSAKETSRGLGHTYKVYHLIYTSPTSIVSCGRDRKILLWDTKKMNAPVMRFGDDNSGTFRSIDFNGNALLASTAESSVEAYDYKTGLCLFKENYDYDLTVFPEDTAFLEPPQIIYSVKFFKNGDFLTGHQDMSIRKFRFSQPSQILSLRRGHFSYVRSVEISEDNSIYVSTGQDGSVRVWSEDTPIASLIGHAQIVSSACITRDNSRVITSSYDQSVCVFNLRH